jgi:hypothetical protein
MFLSLRVERRERVIKKERGNIKLLTNHKKMYDISVTMLVLNMRV